MPHNAIYERYDLRRNYTWRSVTPSPKSDAERNPWLPSHVRLALAESVQRSLIQPSACVPPGGVALGIVDGKMASLRKLSLWRVASQQCLISRFTTLCLGGQHGTGGPCVVSTGPAALPAVNAQFGSESYSQLSWAKWDLLHIALTHGARVALFIDADVVLLSNPFSHLPRHQLLGHHFSFQEEVASCPQLACAAPCRINTGMIAVSNASFTREVLRQLYPRRWKARMPLDQDVL